MAGIADSDRVLDIGCGTGRFTTQVRARRVIGLDRDRRLLRVAQQRNVTCVLGDAHALPFGDCQFDAIVATDGVFAFLEIDQALAEVRRVLAPRGIAAIHYPAHATWTPRRPFGLVRIPRRQSMPASEVVQAARRTGLALETVRLWRWLRWYPYLLPMPPAVRVPIWSSCVILLRRRPTPSAPRRCSDERKPV